MNKLVLSIAALVSLTTMVESASAYEYHPVRGLRPIVRGIAPIYRPPFRGIIVRGRPIYGRPIYGRPIYGRPIYGRPIYGRPVYGRVIYQPGLPGFPRGVSVYRPGTEF